MVKKLFLIRHAESINKDNNRTITENGAEGCHKISEKIREHISGVTVEIWHSPLTNTANTSQLIGNILSVHKLTAKENLISDMNHFTDFEKLRSEIEECEAEVLIIISHLEYVWYYPEFLGYKSHPANYCEGVLIFESKSSPLTI